MKTLDDFLQKFVDSRGGAKVLVNGDYVNLNYPGLVETKGSDCDIYIVCNSSIDPDILQGVDFVVFQSDQKINFRPNHQPEAVMSKLTFKQNVLSENLVVYSRHKLDLVDVKAQATTPEPVTTQPPKPAFEEPVGTTVDPSTIGTPLSISGGASEPDTPEDDTPETKDDLGPKVW